MVRRFEEAPPFSRHVILQLMRPWLRNIELVEEIPRIQTSVMLDHALPSLVASKSTNPVLSGSGWGSLEGTHLVLHNLLYLTTKVEIYMYMYGACNILLLFLNLTDYFVHVHVISIILFHFFFFLFTYSLLLSLPLSIFLSPSFSSSLLSMAIPIRLTSRACGLP